MHLIYIWFEYGTKIICATQVLVILPSFSMSHYVCTFTLHIMLKMHHKLLVADPSIFNEFVEYELKNASGIICCS